MGYLYALTYSKEQYSLEEACRDFISMYVLYDAPESILDNFDSVNFIKENEYLIIEEGINNIIILSYYDFEDFDFIRGE